MTAAIFGLVGVVIGGLLTGAITYAMERRREQREVRAAARLIGMHFRAVGPYLRGMLAGDASTPPSQVSYGYNIWAQYYRDMLASTLSVELWDITKDGMLVVEHMLEHVDGPRIDQEWLKESLEKVERAMEVWLLLAGRRVGGERIKAVRRVDRTTSSGPPS